MQIYTWAGPLYSNFTTSDSRINIHILLKIYNLFVRALEKQIENRAFGEFFWPVSHRVQLTVMLTDNLRIWCLSCNTKKYKTTAKLSDKNKDKKCFSCFQEFSLSRPRALILSPFLLSSLYMNKVPERFD